MEEQKDNIKDKSTEKRRGHFRGNRGYWRGSRRIEPRNQNVANFADFNTKGGNLHETAPHGDSHPLSFDGEDAGPSQGSRSNNNHRRRGENGNSFDRNHELATKKDDLQHHKDEKPRSFDPGRFSERSSRNIQFKNRREHFPSNAQGYNAQRNSVPIFEERDSSPSQGSIVGGRYIRRHGNHSHAANSMRSDYIQTESEISNSYSEGYGREKHFQKRYLPPSYTPIEYNPQRRFSNNYDKGRSYDGYNKSEPNSNNRHFNGSHHSSQKPLRMENTLREENISKQRENEATQRELLEGRLRAGECECLVCCEAIRVRDSTWHCLSCFHVFHLRCIRKWARSPTAIVQDGTGWRCPACQALTGTVPQDYMCFCGKRTDPQVDYHLTPHSCGEVCSRARPNCEHRCTVLCHPGPCPPCAVVVTKPCACGKTNKTAPCKMVAAHTCDAACEKALGCGAHFCDRNCHPGECPPCKENVSQTCFCGKNNRSVSCTHETSSVIDFSCGAPCGKSLVCGNHVCTATCHSGECAPCRLAVESVTACPCGRRSLTELVKIGKAQLRTSCQDPVPTCESECGKLLLCGPKDSPHRCSAPCHTGECPPCPSSTSLRCRCGAFTKDFACASTGLGFVYACERRCNKRKECGRHKCLNKCCINLEHRCELICNKKLSCGSHQCPETCHGGNCPTCFNVSFDELRCYCGEEVLYPPIHCGTKPPECRQPCTRDHPCGHEVRHTCHSDPTCPPCTSLVSKWCFGNHKQCGAVVCFQDGISCGSACGRGLSCGRHACTKTCHAGPCLKNGTTCVQPCVIPREACGHSCGSVCHEPPCVDTPCRTQVTLTCPCGHRSETTTCYDSTRSYKLMSASALASRMLEIKEGQSVDLNDMLGRKSKSCKLQCNEECAVIERNKRLAVALQIQNPELSCAPSTTSYSEWLKDEARKSPAFVADVYDKIVSLVHLAKESKQKCRSHAFPAMNRDQRRVVHELAEFFGCETQSYDDEPKKNVVVTAHKGKCCLPFASIMSVVQRDMGIRKGPTPLIVPKVAPMSQKKKIDYFEYTQ